MRKVNNAIVHLSVWLLYTAFAILVYGYGNDVLASCYETTVSMAIFATVFYVHAGWILPRFLEKKKYKIYGVLLTALYAYFIGIKYFFAFVFDPWLFHSPSSAVGAPPVKVLLIFSMQWLNFAMFSTGYWLFNMLIRTMRQVSLKEKVELENTALRAKLNPHFLFNVLEHFRIASAKQLPKLSASLGSLIFIIRSSITEPGPDGMIPLNRELTAIRCYVAVFKERYPEHPIGFSCQIMGSENYRILPHILMEFVENAFKHGDYKDPEQKISIRLKVADGQLYFNVSNKKRGNHTATASLGSGLNNIKSHLQNGYPNCHELHINDLEDCFEVSLTVFTLNTETLETLKYNTHD